MKLKRIVSLIAAGCMAFCAAAGSMQSASAAGTRVSVHDPSVFKDTDGTYYVFGSHIDAARSNDLMNWSVFTNGYTATNNAIFGNLSQNLAGAFAWAGENLEDCEGGFSVWAPDVIYNPDYICLDGSKGAYLMYFCTTSTYKRSVIAFAESKTAAGPYTFVDTLIYSGFTPEDSWATSSTKNVNRKYTSTNVDELIAAGKVTYNSSWFRGNDFNNQLFPNAIDSTIYYDPDGRMYMTYGSWSGGIFTLELDKTTGRCIHPKSGTTSDGRMVDSYFGTKISGGYGKSGEGPFIEYNPETGYYYLWVTYGGLTATGGYNMRVFRSKSPTGPFVDAAGNAAVLGSNTNLDSIGVKVLGNYQFSCLDTAYMAGGHNSVLCDDDGKWYLLFHTRFNYGNEWHQVRVHSMYFNEEGWPVVSPYEYCGDVKADYGYDEKDIAGTYEYINHGNDTSATIHKYSSITLNADGTISGSASGTWSQAEDSTYAQLTIDGQRYLGHFLVTQDEAGRKVMAFTAIGSNNQTVWGAQTTAYTGTPRDELKDYTDSDSQLVYAADTIGNTSAAVKIGETSLVSGVPYVIRNKNSGLVIDLPDGKSDDGTNIQQWGENGFSAQQWRIVAEDNGYCRIVSMMDEQKCIAVEENTATDGLNIELQSYTGADNQLWKLVKDGSYYGIVSKCSGDTAGFDVFEWSTEYGGNINQWNYWGGDCQLWSIEPVHPMVPDGSYTIRNLNSGLFAADNNGNIEQGGKQVWNFTKQSDGTYVVQDANGNALTVENGSADDGANISLSEYKGDASQKFTVQCNKDGTYSLLTAASGNARCMDVFEISLESGANICQWEYWGGDGQKFVLEPAKAEEPEPVEIVGDVNADGKFTMLDIIMLQKYLVCTGDITDIDAADVCEDGRVNVNDLVVLKKLIKAQ